MILILIKSKPKMIIVGTVPKYNRNIVETGKIDTYFNLYQS
jgi:hypothetical protein